jgi:chloramphenicol 3-O-phosphotransferase
VRGPFYQLESKLGILTDPVVSDLDIIVSANKPAFAILVIGKPRAGKSTTAEVLASSLDLVYIHVQRFIDILLKKISEYEAPDLEEGEEPPKWLSDVEENVNSTLKSGGNLDDDTILEILNS